MHVNKGLSKLTKQLLVLWSFVTAIFCIIFIRFHLNGQDFSMLQPTLYSMCRCFRFMKYSVRLIIVNESWFWKSLQTALVKSWISNPKLAQQMHILVELRETGLMSTGLSQQKSIKHMKHIRSKTLGRLWLPEYLPFPFSSPPRRYCTGTGQKTELIQSLEST